MLTSLRKQYLAVLKAPKTFHCVVSLPVRDRRASRHIHRNEDDLPLQKEARLNQHGLFTYSFPTHTTGLQPYFSPAAR